MRRRMTIAAIAATIMIGALPMGAAHADGGPSSTTVSAVVTGAIGFRNISTLTAGPLTAVGNTSNTVSGTYSVGVTEVTRQSSNPWSLTADSTNFSGASSGGTINKTNMAASARTISGAATNGTNSYSVTSGSTAFGATPVDFGQDAQTDNILHSGTYTAGGTLTLSPPAGTPVDTYTATLTVTLFN